MLSIVYSKNLSINISGFGQNCNVENLETRTEGHKDPSNGPLYSWSYMLAISF